ncbi:MAG: flagellar protein FlgN [Deltaproteobacteria bacterium]|nr:flagellar protein FlgN [Deltaproteobacteria bacterium]
MGQKIQETSDRPAFRNIAGECHLTALQLLATIRKETTLLRRFQGEELLELLPQKEFLVRELESRIRELQSLPECSGEFSRSDEMEALNSVLIQVKDANRVNQMFVEGTLEYWQGLMAVFFPTGYGHRLNPSAGKLSSLPRGVSFSKEI